uniref:Large ribosomal subunit protein mL52 n=1 Tax=Trichuris muris TaxID=70415 RepID=A0A5S6QNR8_TRIMR
MNRFWSNRRPTNGNWGKPDPFEENPDWSYADGRPGTLSTREILRRAKQRELATAIVKGLKEVAEAEAEFAALKRQEAQLKAEVRPKLKHKDFPLN